MMKFIENNFLECKITNRGAELCSLVDKATGMEYIWQKKPEIWNSTSPVLFPSIGNIKNNAIVHNQTAYNMPKHGFVRNNNNLTFSKQKPSKCTFTLINSTETKQWYPFDFKFEIDYELIQNRLIMSYHIQNTGQEPMYYNCGGHTAYSCPLEGELNLSDYSIEFPDLKQLKSNTIGPSGLISNSIRDIILDHGFLTLNESMFLEDALIFKNIGTNWVRLHHTKSNKKLKISFEDYPHLALWSKPKADYVCIEPWLGLPDHMHTATEISKNISYKKLNPSCIQTYRIITEVES